MQGHGASDFILLGFSTIDWWIVGVYVFLAALPGFLCRKYITGQADFLIAGRTLSVFLATATLTATEMGVITVMYWAEFGFTKGFSAMSLGVIAFAATLFVGLTGFMVRRLRESGTTTVAGFYEIRYAPRVRLLGGTILAIAGILNYGIFLNVEAQFIQIVTGIPDLIVQTSDPASAPLEISAVKLVMIVLVVIVLAYTLMGGMVSVAVTDYIQFIVLTLGLGATTIWVLTRPEVGGFTGLVETVQTHRPGYGLNPLDAGEVVNGEVLGLGIAWISWQMLAWLSTNLWQPGAFRTAATDSPRTAKIMWSLTAFNYFGRGVIPMIWGIGALAFIAATMGPDAVDKIPSREAMPTFVSHLPTGLAGLLMAGMLAALMSTHSSYLLTWSGVLTEDIVMPLLNRLGIDLPENRRIWVTRLFIVLLGVFLIYWGLFYEVKATIWGYLAVTGTMYFSGALALVAFGSYWKKASKLGAYLGLLGGALPGLVYMSLGVIRQVLEGTGEEVPGTVELIEGWMTDPNTGLLSFALAIAGMIVGSLISPDRRQQPVPAQDAVLQDQL